MTNVIIHIGFPKAGSTYLQNWFEKHPSFYYQPKAIAGFYNAHDIARYAQYDNSLDKCFVLSSEDLSVWKGDFEVVGFEAKPYDIALYHKRITSLLYKIFPTAKVLIVTRGYDSMLKSLYSQYIKGGGVLTFEELQDVYGEYFTQLYSYSHIIGQYREVFGADNTIVMPYELLRESPEKFTEVIEQKVGVAANFLLGRERVNASLDKKNIRAYRLASKTVKAIIRPLPRKWQQVIYRWHVSKLLFSKQKVWLDFFADYFDGDELVVKASLISSFRGKADIFRNEDLYQPFLKEYLI